MNTVTDKILRKIYAKQRGWVFTQKDFMDFGGTRAAVDKVLSRLAKQGKIRRLDRGVYDYPKQHAFLGVLSPDTDSLARVITAKSGNSVFTSGAMAANLLGLSTQVPAKPIYLTDGPSRIKKVAGRIIAFKHARVPLFKNLSTKANYVLQALSYLGKDAIDDAIIICCAGKLDNQDIRFLINISAKIPGWIADIVKKIKRIKDGNLCGTI